MNTQLSVLLGLGALGVAVICVTTLILKGLRPMEETKVVDWRVWKAATVAADAQPIEPGGSPAKKGDVLYVVSTMTEPIVGEVNFITPSPVALALNIAIRSASEAVATRKSILWTTEGKGGTAKWASTASLPALYAYFEQSMIAATFSFQSLEAFANQVVVQSLKGTLKFKGSKGEVEWDASEIERNASTEEKLGTVLPSIGKVSSPKGSKVWENVIKLKGVRDGTIHLKELNQYVRGTVDKQTVYYHFLNQDPRDYPRWAIAMMRQFVPVGSDSWLVPAEALLT